MKYGDETNGFVFTMIEEDTKSFTVKIITDNIVRMLLLKRAGANSYLIIIKDNFDPQWAEEQIFAFLKEKIAYYIMNEKPENLVSA